MVLHPDIQLAGQNRERGQQETEQRLRNLLDEGKPGEQGLPSSGKRRRRLGETPGLPGVRTAKQGLPPAKIWDMSVPWVTLETFFQTHFPPTAELHSGAGETEVKAEPWSLWLSCDRARDTPRDCVEQPKTSSPGDTVQGKDVTFNPCCPLAVLVTGIFTPGKGPGAQTFSQPGTTLSCWWHQEPALESDLPQFPLG